MFRLFALLIGYVIGSVQTAYIVGRIYGIDIRDHGSKNAGMTNVTRTLGKKQGAVVFLIDVLKGVAVFLCATVALYGASWLYPIQCNCAIINYFDGMNWIDCRRVARHVLPGIYAGLGTVLGHCFPVFFKFRGGKGMACTLGIILMMDWRVALITFGVAVASIIVTRYISLASLLITLLAPIVMVFFGFGPEEIILMAGVGALIWVLHRENIKRLAAGTERKFLKKN